MQRVEKPISCNYKKCQVNRNYNKVEKLPIHYARGLGSIEKKVIKFKKFEYFTYFHVSRIFCRFLIINNYIEGWALFLFYLLEWFRVNIYLK